MLKQQRWHTVFFNVREERALVECCIQSLERGLSNPVLAQCAILALVRQFAEVQNYLMETSLL